MLAFRHIVFDLDGTLVDSLPGIEWSAREALAACGAGPLLRDLGPLLGSPKPQASTLPIGWMRWSAHSATATIPKVGARPSAFQAHSKPLSNCPRPERASG